VNEPTGGWTDAWPRWGLYALALLPCMVAAIVFAVGLVTRLEMVAFVGGCLAVPSLPLLVIGSLSIDIDKLGYVSLEYAHRHETRAACRAVRRQERRAKRICLERGISRLYDSFYADDIIWRSWEDSLAQADIAIAQTRQAIDARLTPQELFVKGDIDMDELERRIADER